MFIDVEAHGRVHPNYGHLLELIIQIILVIIETLRASEVSLPCATRGWGLLGFDSCSGQAALTPFN